MRRYLLSVVLFLLPVPAAAAENGFSATIGAVSDHVYHGESQTGGKPALQVSVDYAHESGLYAGLWGSNVDFDDANLETDFYAGYRGESGPLSWDIGFIYYAYPGADSDLGYDYYEAAAALGYDFDAATLTASLNYTPDYFGGSGNGFYPALKLEIPFPIDFTLKTHAGYQFIEEESGTADWSLGFERPLGGFDLSLTYSQNNLEGGDPHLVFGISRSLPEKH